MGTLYHYLALSSLVFVIGIYGVLTRRNAISLLMSIELMLNAANINLVAFNHFLGDSLFQGQIFVLFVITLAACEAAVGLVLILSIYRHIKTIDVQKMNLLKW
ncbi:MAG: NADH-quinone oxidoreductase subunit NuoK [Candidatus Firestonebacteria bacterium]